MQARSYSFLWIMFLATSLLITSYLYTKPPHTPHLRGQHIIIRQVQQVWTSSYATVAESRQFSSSSVSTSESSTISTTSSTSTITTSHSMTKSLINASPDMQLGVPIAKCQDVVKCQNYNVPGVGNKKVCKPQTVCPTV